jgi:FkbM family methyltransferase
MKACEFYNEIREELVRSVQLANVTESSLFENRISADNASYVIFRKFTNQRIRNMIAGFFGFFGKKDVKKFELSTNSPLKVIALDYLTYMLLNNPEIPYKLFPEKDRKTISQFLRTMIYAALFENLTESFIGKENLNKYLAAYKNNDEIKIKNGYFEFGGFKSKKPYFESLFHDYGLNLLKKKKHKICIDLGAYIGDTSYMISRSLKPQKIYAFEPDFKNAPILTANLKLNKLDKVVETVYLATDQINGQIEFESLGSASFVGKKTKTSYMVNSVTLDSFIKNKNIEKVSLIKMDIEGAEFNTLKGAIKTLKRDKPDLIVAIYHKGEHFFEIPAWLKKTVPEYNLRFLAFSEASPIVERVLVASTEKIWFFDWLYFLP